MNKQFEKFFHGFMKQYTTDVFNTIPQCKSLLRDHAKGEYDKEIRLVLQALELGCHTAILKSKDKDLHLTRLSLVKQIRDEHFINEEIAAALIDLLLLELRNYKFEPEKPAQEQTQKKSRSKTQSQSSSSAKNSIPVNKDYTQKLDSLIDEKKQKEINYETFMAEYKDFLKNVCVPAFAEYYETMRERGFECRYYYSADGSGLYFDFTPFKRGYDRRRYSIFPAASPVTQLKIENLKSAYSNHYNLNQFKKEIIIDDLLRITEFLLKREEIESIGCLEGRRFATKNPDTVSRKKFKLSDCVMWCINAIIIIAILRFIGSMFRC
jgi:ethanolamine utilization protein EutQ (cupin superfamily)